MLEGVEKKRPLHSSRSPKPSLIKSRLIGVSLERVDLTPEIFGRLISVFFAFGTLRGEKSVVNRLARIFHHQREGAAVPDNGVARFLTSERRFDRLHPRTRRRYDLAALRGEKIPAARRLAPAVPGPGDSRLNRNSLRDLMICRFRGRKRTDGFIGDI